jgi:outer membrane protein TolC
MSGSFAAGLPNPALETCEVKYMNKNVFGPSRPLVRLAATVLVASLVAGCASEFGSPGPIAVSSAAGGSRAATMVGPGYADLAPVRRALTGILSTEVDADAAVRIALLASPALHRIYFDLRLSGDDIANAATASLQAAETVEVQFATAVIGSSRRSATEVDSLKFEQAKLEMAGEVVRLALDVRRAHAAAVAARQVANLTDDLKTASEASAELGRRMARVGNWPRLNEYRESAALGTVSVQTARARLAETAARERLTRLLGLWGADAQYRLPEALAQLPARLEPIADPEIVAANGRFDIRAMVFDIAAETREFELDDYEAGELRAGTGFYDLPRAWALGADGSAGTISVPLFDLRNQASHGKSVRFMGLLTRASQAAISARADAREAFMAQRTAYDIARHYSTHMLPLQVRIMDESVQRYNGMLTGVFDLLADARQKTAVEIAAVEALRDYWIATANLGNALLAGGYSGGSVAAGSASAAPEVAPAGH